MKTDKITRTVIMITPKVFDSEYNFCLVLWEREPITVSDIAKICKEKLNWSRTTTYTVIRRLEDRGVLKRTNSLVTSLYSKEQIQLSAIEELLENRFNNSVSDFITAIKKPQVYNKTKAIK